jgi:hypothetical protein
MKGVKLTKKQMSGDLVYLLTSLGAVYENQAFPQHIYVSKETYKTLQDNYKKLLKKDHKNISKHHLEVSMGYEFLNLGPNEDDDVAYGHALVDEDAIKADIRGYVAHKQ